MHVSDKKFGKGIPHKKNKFSHKINVFPKSGFYIFIFKYTSNRKL